jgi:hypothetical protein
MSREPKYKCPYTIVYKSPRYNKTVTVEKGFGSDGATGAIDIWSEGWWVHDKLCDTLQWDDGTPCTPWQRSCVLGDILKAEGRWARAFGWKYATYLWDMRQELFVRPKLDTDTD